MKQKCYVELNRQEWRLIIEGLNRFRNKLIAAGPVKIYAQIYLQAPAE